MLMKSVQTFTTFTWIRLLAYLLVGTGLIGAEPVWKRVLRSARVKQRGPLP